MAYWDFLQVYSDYDEKRVDEAVARGDEFLKAAGPVGEATAAIRGVWSERYGYHLGGAFDKSPEPLAGGALLEYARKEAGEVARMSSWGVL